MIPQMTVVADLTRSEDHGKSFCRNVMFITAPGRFTQTSLSCSAMIVFTSLVSSLNNKKIQAKGLAMALQASNPSYTSY